MDKSCGRRRTRSGSEWKRPELDQEFLEPNSKRRRIERAYTIECGSERAIQEGELSVTHQLCMSHTFFACHLSFSHLFRLS